MNPFDRLIMRKMIVFNDNSPEAENAMEFALNIGRKVKSDIWILSLVKKPQDVTPKCQIAGERQIELMTDTGHGLSFENISDKDFYPAVIEIDASEYTGKEIYELIIRENSWMMVEGVETHVTHEVLCSIDVQSVLNHVACPLLLVPDNYTKGYFQNIIYAVDMRYCRTAVLKFLAELAEVCQANLFVEHLSAKGLPPLGDEYAQSLFNGQIMNKINYDKVYFNNIKERNLDVAIDVVINDLHADLLALVNHRFHFEELFGRSIKNVLPDHIPVPVIIFPL